MQAGARRREENAPTRRLKNKSLYCCQGFYSFKLKIWRFSIIKLNYSIKYRVKKSVQNTKYKTPKEIYHPYQFSTLEPKPLFVSTSMTDMGRYIYLPYVVSTFRSKRYFYTSIND